MLVAVHTILTGEAAKIGGVRYQQHGKAVILLARDISVEEQAALLADLADEDDRLDFTATVPTPRSAPVEQVRVAG